MPYLRSAVVTCAAAALLLAFGARPVHAEIIVKTNDGLGADAEVRESNPTQNRGSSTEIASRIRNDFPLGDDNDGSDRNSVIYLQFDLAGLTPADATNAILRMTYRNNNLNATRISDTDGLAPDLGRTGMTYYGITARSGFDESTITYLNAPGMTPDGDVGTVDFNSDATPLGSVLFPEIGDQNWLPVGGALDFSSAALDSFLGDAITNGLDVVVFAVVRSHEDTADTPALWTNFNYLFNPKEQTTLNSDPNYDPDGNGPVGSPYSGADNSTGDFSPQLVLNSAIPTPAALPAGLVALGLLASRRRRR